MHELWKMFENIGDIKLITTEKGRNYLVSETITIIQSFSQKICWLYK